MTTFFLLLAFTPAELAPAVQDLDEAWGRLQELTALAEAAGAATVRLQTEWTRTESPRGTCDNHDRLALGWRIERFGAAWREGTQAARAQGERVATMRKSPTVAPLVDARKRAELTALLARVEAESASFLQASAWEVAFVRPVLSACPIAGVGLSSGVSASPVLARNDQPLPIAVLAMGSGFVCPAGVRAEESVVLVQDGQACWAPDAGCACTPEAVYPGAVLGPPVVDGTGPAGAETTITP